MKRRSSTGISSDVGLASEARSIRADGRRFAEDVVDLTAEENVEQPGVIRDHVRAGPGIGRGMLAQPVVRDQAVLMLADPLPDEMLGFNEVLEDRR